MLFGCIFFDSDFTLTVINKNEKDLSLTCKDAEFAEKQKIRMKWDKQSFTGTIVKTSESKKFLELFVTKASDEILTNRGTSTTAEEVLDELLEFSRSFQRHGDNSGKRLAKPTPRAVESKAQDKELIPKKKRKTEVLPKESKKQSRGLSPKANKSAEKENKESNLRKAKKNTGKSSVTQFTSENKKFEDGPGSHKKQKQLSISSTSRQDSCDILDQFKDDNEKYGACTSLTETWDVCQGKQNFPKPNSDVIRQLKVLIPLVNMDLQRYFRRLVSFFENDDDVLIENLEPEPAICNDTAEQINACSTYQPDYDPPVSPQAEQSRTQQVENQQNLRRSPRKHPSSSQPAANHQGNTIFNHPISEPYQQWYGYNLNCFGNTSQFLEQIQDPSMQPSQSSMPETQIYVTGSQSVGSQHFGSQLVGSQFSSPISQSTGPQHEFTGPNRQTIGLEPQSSGPMSIECKTSGPQKENILAKKDKSEEKILLIEGHNIMIYKEDRKSACEKASKAADKGYTLTMKLLYALFTVKEMAESRGQGLMPQNEGESKVPLNKEILEAIKAFVAAWCHKHGFEIPARAKYTKAVTEAVCYCRKIIKKKGH